MDLFLKCAKSLTAAFAALVGFYMAFLAEVTAAAIKSKAPSPELDSLPQTSLMSGAIVSASEKVAAGR